MDGNLKMIHLGDWFKGPGELDMPGDRLTPNRLADMLDLLRSAPPEEPTMASFCDSSEEPPVAEASRQPSSLAIKLRRPAPAPAPATAPAPALAAPVAPAALAVPGPAVAVTPVSGIGRHRSPPKQRLTIRGVSFTSRRLAVMGVLALGVFASTVLLTFS